MNFPPHNDDSREGTFDRFTTAFSDRFTDFEKGIDYEVLRDSATSRRITVHTVTDERTSGSKRDLVLEKGVGWLITRDGDSLEMTALNTGKAHSLKPGTTYYYRTLHTDHCIIHEVDILNTL